MRSTLTSAIPFPVKVNKSLLIVAGLISLIAVMSGFLGNPFFMLSVVFLTVLFPLSVVIRLDKFWDLVQPIPERIFISLVGSISALSITLFMWSIRTVVELDILTVATILQLEWFAIFILALLVISVQGLHIVLYGIHKKIIAHQSNNTKFLFYITGLLTILTITGFDARLLLIHTAAYIIYSLLLDLFIEEKRTNLIWLVLWTIILGSFLSMAIVQGTNQFNLQAVVPIQNAFTLFSIIFILSAVIYTLFGFLNFTNRILPPEWEFNFRHTLHLRNRIQLSILITLIFSFIAIGFISIHNFKNLDNATFGLESGFIPALLNTYVFLFLIGFSISFSLSQYIRNPLIELGKTIKEVKLNKTNRRIEWKGSDEIGTLISEYNKMIDKLEVNASLLAQVERDNAWREMAKQVAHEIKNPLTPMKLSLQHLQRSIQADRNDVNELTQRMCQTLMNQVENLQQIADEFANFGSLPQANNKRILLNEVVERIHDLFRNRQDMDIHLIEPIDDIGVYADKNQLIRVLTNIVKNSIQAIPEDRKGYIELKLTKEKNKAIISVRDNGIGIPEQQRKEIFKPRFTTKSSGSGLGLPIAANMIDAMGGTIHFDSIPGEGTEFFIELPLIRSAFSKSLNRVTLE